MSPAEELKLKAQVTALEIMCSQALSLVFAQQLKGPNLKADLERIETLADALLSSNTASVEATMGGVNPASGAVVDTMARVLSNASRDALALKKTLGY